MLIHGLNHGLNHGLDHGLNHELVSWSSNILRKKMISCLILVYIVPKYVSTTFNFAD